MVFSCIIKRRDGGNCCKDDDRDDDDDDDILLKSGKSFSQILGQDRASVENLL